MINFIEKIMRQNIRGYTIIGANKILDNHWEWMKNNVDTNKKIIVKEINLKDFYGLNK
jgi:hypothetical protein